MAFDRLRPNGVGITVRAEPVEALFLASWRYAPLRIASAFLMFGGAPMSNHRPWWTMPKQRPAAIARSHRMLVEKGPSGQLAREQPLREHLDAGEDEGRDAVRLAPPERAGGAHVEIAAALMAMGARQRHQQQQRVHPRLVPARRRAAAAYRPARRSRDCRELTTRNGSASISGSALTSPPPVSSNCLRSSEIAISMPSTRLLEMRFERVGADNGR